MFLFAEIDATGWTVIVGAVFLGATNVLAMWLSYLRERDKIRRDAAAAEKLEEVHEAAEVAAAKAAEAAEKIEVVRKQSDGMKTELVNEVRKASFAAGVKQEKDKNGGGS